MSWFLELLDTDWMCVFFVNGYWVWAIGLRVVLKLLFWTANVVWNMCNVTLKCNGFVIKIVT